MVQRRTFLKSTATGVATIGAAGCVGDDADDTATENGNDTGDGDSIYFLTDNSDEEWQEYFTRMGQEFTEETGIRVTWDFVGLGAGKDERLTTLIQSGNPPTLLDTNAMQEGGELFAQGLLEPVDDLVEEQQEEFGDLPDVRRFAPGGVDYIVPGKLNIWFDYFNADEYEEPIDTYEQMLEQAEIVDERVSPESRAAIVPGAPRDFSDFYMYTLGAVHEDANAVVLNGDDAEFVMEDNKEAWLEVLNYCKELHQYSDTNADIGFGDAIINFGEGVGEHICFSLSQPRILETAYPERSQIVNSQSITAPEGKRAGDAWFLMNGPAIMSSDLIGEAQVESAKEFIRFLYMDLERMAENHATEPLSEWPVYPSIRNSDVYQNQPVFEQHPGLLDWLDDIGENIAPGALRGAQAGQAMPWFGAIAGTNLFGQMLHDHLIQDLSASEAFDNNVDGMREAFESVNEQMQ